MFVLFLAHHILNRKWLASMAKGKYNAFRGIQTLLAIIMFVLMIGSMISGILLSDHIFKMIRVDGSYMIARQIHMVCTYWGFVVMSLHLGMHWNMVVLMTGRLFEKPSLIRAWIARSIAIAERGGEIIC